MNYDKTDDCGADKPYMVLKGYDPNQSRFDYNEFYYLYFSLPILKNAKLMVETGLGMGTSSQIFLEALSQLPNPETRTLHTFDALLWDGPKNAVETVRARNFPAKWIFHPTDSLKGGDEMPADTSIDLLYLDADHSYQSVSGELKSFERYLRDDTLIWTHDSMPTPDPTDAGRKRPSDTYRAVKEWGDAHGYSSLLYPFPQGITLLYKAKT